MGWRLRSLGALSFAPSRCKVLLHWQQLVLPLTLCNDRYTRFCEPATPYPTILHCSRLRFTVFSFYWECSATFYIWSISEALLWFGGKIGWAMMRYVAVLDPDNRSLTGIVSSCRFKYRICLFTIHVLHVPSKAGGSFPGNGCRR